MTQACLAAAVHDGLVAADDFENAASELYAAPRENFIPLRKQLAEQARAAGEKALAEQISRLAKPTMAAWLANGLARKHAEAVRDLVELGDLMRDATERMAGDELRALSQRRPQLIRALVRDAADVSGQPLRDAVSRELDEILTAAVTDVDTGRALQAGRLTSAREAAPLGAWPQVLPGAAAVRERPAAAPKQDRSAGPDRGDQSEAAGHPAGEPSTPTPEPARPSPQEVAAAEQAMDRAREAVKEAESARGERERELQSAEQEAEAAAAEVLRLTELLDAAEGREREARRRVVAARHSVKDAEREASQAWREVQLAERRLSDLQGTGAD